MTWFSIIKNPKMDFDRVKEDVNEINDMIEEYYDIMLPKNLRLKNKDQMREVMDSVKPKLDKLVYKIGQKIRDSDLYYHPDMKQTVDDILSGEFNTDPMDSKLDDLFTHPIFTSPQ